MEHVLNRVQVELQHLTGASEQSFCAVLTGTSGSGKSSVANTLSGVYNLLPTKYGKKNTLLSTAVQLVPRRNESDLHLQVQYVTPAHVRAQEEWDRSDVEDRLEALQTAICNDYNQAGFPEHVMRQQAALTIRCAHANKRFWYTEASQIDACNLLPPSLTCQGPM